MAGIPPLSKQATIATIQLRRCNLLGCDSRLFLQVTPVAGGPSSQRTDVDYFEDGAGVMESRVQNAFFNVELEWSEAFTVQGSRNFERLVDPFPVGGGVEVAPDGYSFSNVRASYMFGPQRRLAGTVSVQVGDFYDGTIKSIRLTTRSGQATGLRTRALVVKVTRLLRY
jgi:hypothetical protein